MIPRNTEQKRRIKNGLRALKHFLEKRRPKLSRVAPTAVSLFSGAGISDMGYAMAGFRFVVQVELDADRAELGQRNFPKSKWLKLDVSKASNDIVAAYRDKCKRRLDLLVATPPCQGMSSSNPSRGKRKSPEARRNEHKNNLLLAVVPVARTLRPRFIVAENVRQILTHSTHGHDGETLILERLASMLPEYRFFATRVNVANHGIPQTRWRALIVGVHEKEPWLKMIEKHRRTPWPAPTHSDNPSDGLLSWATVKDWLQLMEYPKLSSRSPDAARDTHPLHFVPHYNEDRYLLVKSIPPHSGRSAYQNDACPSCGVKGIAEGRASCSQCGQPMRNRPIVIKGGPARLIRGFASSYRRMKGDEPASTVTTNSSHIGSDNKIHPCEHRVLSILECADLQTVPRFFDWSYAMETDRKYLIRNVIGEAFPTYFTYLHGRVIHALVTGRKRSFASLAPMSARVLKLQTEARTRL
ncbi:MAG: DNA cytosine methyltransferase [Candidatus Eisenbacteria bacterium]